MERGKAAGTTSLLSKKVKIEGELQGNEDLHVEGHFKGSIKITGDLFIGPTGIVEADVEANNVIVQGQVTGNIMAHKQLQLQSSGIFLGDCAAQSIHINEGALFEGRSKMIKSSAAITGGKPGGR